MKPSLSIALNRMPFCIRDGGKEEEGLIVGRQKISISQGFIPVSQFVNTKEKNIGKYY